MPGRGLEGFRIVECGEMVAASYATKLMADMGAEVVKIEQPRGRRFRPSTWSFSRKSSSSREERIVSLPEYEQTRDHARPGTITWARSLPEVGQGS